MSSPRTRLPEADGETLPINWHRFLTRRLPPVPPRLDQHNLVEYVRTTCTDLLTAGAQYDGLLPRTTLFAQFHTIPPPGVLRDEVRFRLGELIRTDRKAEVEREAARQARFVKKCGVSFFRSAVNANRGMIWILSGSDREEDTEWEGLGRGEVVRTRLPIQPPSRPRDENARLEYLDRDLSQSDDDDPEPEFDEVPIDCTALPQVIQDILGTNAGLYLRSIQSLASLGELILCVPHIYEGVDGPSVGGGGLFLLECPCQPEQLRGLHALTHRLTTIVSDAYHLADRLARTESDRRLSAGLAMLHHSRGNTLSKSLHQDDGATHVGRVLTLEKFSYEAALIISRGNSDISTHILGECGFDGEPFATTLSAVLARGKNGCRLLVEVEDGLDRCEFDALALALLVECCTNAMKHHHHKGPTEEVVTIQADPRHRDRFRLRRVTTASVKDLSNLESRIAVRSTPSREAEHWVLLLTERVAASAEAIVSWTFRLRAEPAEEYKESRGPGWVLKRPTHIGSSDSLLVMELIIDSLQRVRRSSR